jgi:serine/threonine-protein kinase
MEPDPFVGRTLAGRYEVLKKLNQGGVGVVYLAMQRPLDRPVALKLLLRKHADDPTAIKRFEKEAASIARLAHAHIVTVYDFGTTDDGDLFLAMEFLRGQSLRDLLDAAHWLPWERTVHIVRGVTRALVAAHTQKIIHRDLKPENIMLVESNGDLDFAKVLDFGLARSIQGDDGADKITRHDVIPGTPAYMSPERVNGISDDPRSDLYALGAVWFELLCGEPPFPGETSLRVILRHVHEPPRAPSSVQTENPVPPFVDELVLSLLEKQPERRPASATALLQRLDALARPPGWQIAGADELLRQSHHDGAVAGYTVAAAALAATIAEDSNELRFALAEGEPLPLTKKKPAPSLSPASVDEPLLLTKRKAPSLAPAHADGGGFFDEPITIPDAQAPVSAAAAHLASSSSGQRRPTEDFLLLTSAEQEAQIAALHDAAASGIPARIESVAVAAGWLGTARTARAVGELCVAFLASRFDRVVVVDVRGPVPLALARAGLHASIDVAAAVSGNATLRELAARREAHYGPSSSAADWMAWYALLGGTVPGAMFVAGLQSDGVPGFVFYADHKGVALRPSKDIVVLLREAAAALTLVA